MEGATLRTGGKVIRQEDCVAPMAVHATHSGHLRSCLAGVLKTLDMPYSLPLVALFYSSY